MNQEGLQGIEMKDEEYHWMSSVEDTMWWYRGLHKLVADGIGKLDSAEFDVLDAGSGTGGMLKYLSSQFPPLRLWGVDVSEQACIIARKKSGAKVVCGSIEHIPFPNESFDVVISLDVLGYPINIDQSIDELYRVIKPGGRLILNLAAYQWLYSYHDVAVGQRTRFCRKPVIDLLKKHNFYDVAASYWNTFLFPLMMLRRKFVISRLASDVKTFNPILNGLFYSMTAFEGYIIGRGLTLPFGGSIFVMARK